MTENPRAERVRISSDGRQTVKVTPNPSQSDADVEHDFTISFRHGEQMTERGTDEYRSVLRWIGPVKIMVSKEVGPPPWPWPKLKVNLSHNRHWFFSIGAGWHSTLYSFHVMWVGTRPTGSGAKSRPSEARPRAE